MKKWLNVAKCGWWGLKLPVLDRKSVNVAILVGKSGKLCENHDLDRKSGKIAISGEI